MASELLIQADSPPKDTKKELLLTPSTQSKLRLAYFHSDRLEAFCDAVLSIIATILIAPLKLSEKQLKDSSLRELIIQGHSPHFPRFYLSLLYFCSVFFFVVSAWNKHVKIFYLYPVADNFILWLNIIFLFACSFLPLATAFLEIGAVPMVITLLFSSSLVIGLVQSVQILYGYWLRKSLPSYTEDEQFRKIIITFQIISYLTSPTLLFLVLCLSFINSPVGQNIFSLVLFLVLFSEKFIILIERAYARYRLRRNPMDTFRSELKRFNNAVSKSRVEFFSDGVFAIVATIVILDTTSELSGLILDKNIHLDDGLDVWQLNSITIDILYESRFRIYSYVMSFLLVCLFWFIHHSIFHYIRQMNRYILTINMSAQMFVCLIPFCSSILVAYANRQNDPDLSLAITITCLVLFCISILQLLLWIVVRFWTRDGLTQDLEHVADLQMLIRLLLVPVLSLILLLVSAISYHNLSILALTSIFVVIIPALILIEGIYFLYFMTKKYYDLKYFSFLKKGDA